MGDNLKDTSLTLIEETDEFGNTICFFHWPFCQIEECFNRIKLGVSDKYCHPHSGGEEADKLIKDFNELTKMAAEN